MNIEETKRIIHVCLNADVVPVIWGYDGLGKTEVTHQVGEEWLGEPVEEGKNFVTINLANHSDAGDLIGIPIEKMMEELERTVFALPDLWPTDGKGIIFLDEFNRAAISIMQSMYPFILQRRLHRYSLPKGWRIILACNPDGNEYSVNPMDPALMTRFAHVMFEPQMEEWLAWAKKSSISNYISMFVESSGPEVLYGTLKDKKVATLIKVDQRPRTHALLSKLLHVAGDDGEVEPTLLELLARAVLGDQIGVSFSRFVETKTEKPIPGKDIIEGYKTDKKLKAAVSEWSNQAMIKTAVLKKTAENATEELLKRFIARDYKTDKKELDSYVAFLLDIPKEIAVACLRHDIHDAMHEHAQKFPEEERKNRQYVYIDIVQELAVHPDMTPITSLSDSIANMKDHDDHKDTKSAPAVTAAAAPKKKSLMSKLTGK